MIITLTAFNFYFYDFVTMFAYLIKMLCTTKDVALSTLDVFFIFIFRPSCLFFLKNIYVKLY